MNSRVYSSRTLLPVLFLLAACLFVASPAPAQQFNFDDLQKEVRAYTVVIDMNLEVSFGIHSNEESERYLGTIVTEDGLVIFDGSSLAADAGLATFSGFSVKTVPSKIEITTLDGKRYDGEYVGVDRFTNIGFLRITSDSAVFTPVKFKEGVSFRVGDWLGLYMLLPEFISPSLAADVGMISANVSSPEKFPLTVGFNSLQMTSVLFNEQQEAVGVLGALMDPTAGGADAGSLLESFGQFGIPLLGVVTAERLQKLIADPPVPGEPDRGWIGITLQALTRDMAEFWGLDLTGGIIVGEVVKNSPAEEAGLEVGDIIYEVNGQPIDIDKEEKIPVFQRLISEMGPGASVELGLIRRDATGADTLNLLLTLGEAPIDPSDAAEFENKTFELKVRDLVFRDYMITNQDRDTFSGVVVSELQMGGLAAVGGLRIGDIIQRINGRNVTSVDDAEAVMTEIEQQKPGEVVFFVWRDNKTLFVNVKTDW